MTDNKAKRIAAFNDQFRANFFFPSFGPQPVPGHVLHTPGIASLPGPTQVEIWAQVSRFKAFSADNDPYNEHDFGALDVAPIGKVFWKIEYYGDNSCASGAEDPSDPHRSYRVLTIMLASEY